MFEKDVKEKTVWDNIDDAERKFISSKKGHPFLLFAFLLTVMFSAFAFLSMMHDGWGLFYNVRFDEYAVKQNHTGELSLIEEPGSYWRGFNRSIYLYPRKTSIQISDDIVVSFSDGERIIIDIAITLDFPTSIEERFVLHLEMNGNAKNLVKEVREAALRACQKITITMTAKESYLHRRAEMINTIQTEIPKTINKFGLIFPILNIVDISGIYIGSIRYSDVFIKRMEEENIAKNILLKAQYEKEKDKAIRDKILEQEIWKKEWEDANSIEEKEAIQVKYRAIIRQRIKRFKSRGRGTEQEVERIKLLMKNRGIEKIDPNEFVREKMLEKVRVINSQGGIRALDPNELAALKNDEEFINRLKRHIEYDPNSVAREVFIQKAKELVKWREDAQE